jgi:integrase
MKILFMNGVEIVMVSKLMGHRSQKTTRQYIKLMDNTKRNAV